MTGLDQVGGDTGKSRAKAPAVGRPRELVSQNTKVILTAVPAHYS